jgi:hypothetical protein
MRVMSDLKDNLEWVAGGMTALLTVVSFFADGRKTLRAGWKGLLWMLRMVAVPLWAPWWMVSKVRALIERSERRDVEFAAFKANVESCLGQLAAELDYNGGNSLKDKVTTQEGYRAHEFRMQPRPAFTFDAVGLLVEASDALCHLLGVADKRLLQGLNWKTFLYTEDAGALFAALLVATGAAANFRWRSRWVDAHSASRGAWEILAGPVLVKPDGRKLYTAIMRPVDDDARRIAAAEGWES